MAKTEIIGSYLEDGEFILEHFERLSHRSKALIFSYMFKDGKDFDTNALYYYYLESFDFEECQSPIEELYAIAYNIRLMQAGFPYKEIIYLIPQKRIVVNNHTYFADFLIDVESSQFFISEHNYKLIIECDGHEFHEKTKAQVEKRNVRDMELKSNGYDILHFSGSQIFKDPMKCADETFKYITSKIGEVKATYGNI